MLCLCPNANRTGSRRGTPLISSGTHNNDGTAHKGTANDGNIINNAVGNTSTVVKHNTIADTFTGGVNTDDATVNESATVANDTVTDESTNDATIDK